MCGRYALGIRAAFARRQLQQDNMQVDDWAEDDETRETYNFAPGYNGLVYRANVPDIGTRAEEEDADDQQPEIASADLQRNAGSTEPTIGDTEQVEVESTMDKGTLPLNGDDTRYKLQAMRWGLIPFWTKRNPEYGSMMRTINCRDDSLLENRGMWTSMKKKKRCIVLAQGFYEWLKKNGGKEKIPHYVKRRDDKLMCFAGLWDCVQYEGSDEKVYTYTIITTDSNKQLNFLHDRMPVMLENGSEQIRTWLDPKLTEWSKELQSLLKPFDGELDCYAVNKDVGKVGNNTPDFIVPVASTQNKGNIANFFANADKTKKNPKDSSEIKSEAAPDHAREQGSNKDDRKTVNPPRSEDNAPMPQPKASPKQSTKRSLDEADEKILSSGSKAASEEDFKPARGPSPVKKKLRSSTSNGTIPKSSPSKAGDGNQRITSFFNK